MRNCFAAILLLVAQSGSGCKERASLNSKAAATKTGATRDSGLAQEKTAEARAAASALVDAVRRKDYQGFDAAIKAIQRHRGGRLVVTDLIFALESNDGEVRRFAAEALEAIGPDAAAAVPALIEMLDDGYGGFVANGSYAASALGKIGEAAVPSLIDLLSHKRAAYRLVAAFALGEAGPAAKPAVPHLEMLLRDKIVDVRRWAAEALGKIGPDAVPAIPALIELLHDRDDPARRDAAEALRRIGRYQPQVVIPALVTALEDDEDDLYSADVKSNAARALAMFGPAADSAVSGLFRLRRSSDPQLREVAVEALRSIDPDAKPPIADYVEALKDDSSSVRVGALEALAELGPEAKEAGSSALIELLDHENVLWRLWADASLRALDYTAWVKHSKGNTHERRR